MKCLKVGSMLLKLSPKVALNVIVGMAIALSADIVFPLLFSPRMGEIAIAQVNTTAPTSSSNRTSTATGKNPQGACPTNLPIPLTALIPLETTVMTQGKTLTYSLAKTASPRPKLWVYMPYTTANGFELELEVQQEGRTDVPWKQSLLSPKTPGVIRLSVPPGTMPKLVVGQLYKWSLTVKCNPINRVSGWIERVDDPVASRVVGLAKAAAYAKAEIWYDALTVLGDLRRNGSPAEQKAAFEAWKKLLTDAPMKLPDVATQEIVPN